MPEVLCLIDGHALAYRTYFALTGYSAGANPSTSRWATSKGEPTAGVYGFTSVLLRILEQEQIDYLAVAFDTGRTFRHEFYNEYKATRAKMPDDLRLQIERIRQIVDAFNIPRLEKENYEADDVLGSVAYSQSARGLGIKIFTGDRDLLQLVSDRIVINLPGKTLADSRDYLAQDVETLLGVRPNQVVDMKALVGDKSDNIPGVPGIGEKTAVSLLGTYDTLDNIYAHLDDISTGVRKKLEEGRELAHTSRHLATIVTDLSIPIDLDQARLDRFDEKKVEEIFRELEFQTLLKRFKIWSDHIKGVEDNAKIWHSREDLQQLPLFGGEKPVPSAISVPSEHAVNDLHVVIVDTSEKLESLAAEMKTASVIAFDTETTSIDPVRADLVGISLATQVGKGYYIPIGHRSGVEGERNLPIEIVVAALGDSLMDPTIPKVGHNLKYDYVMLARHGINVTPLSFDTMIAEWLINPDSRNLGLKRLAWVRLNLQMTEIETLIGKGKNQRTMDIVPISDAAPYAVGDVDAVLRLMPALQKEIEGNDQHSSSNLWKLFSELEMPLIPVLADMEMNGISLDTQFLTQMSSELQTRLREIETQVLEMVGEPFNLNSPQQLSHALFEKLQLKLPGRTKRTASGAFSTSVEVLDALRGSHPVVDLVLEYREVSKLKSTYVDALPAENNPRTGRVHTSYNQTGAVTGRIASSDPNLQNIPIRTELGRQVRKAFIASPNWMLISVDYSQVELRIVAHMAQDEAMIAAFRAGQDIHTATAAAIFNVSLEKVTKEQRRHAKSINFGLIYGMSAFGLTRSSELTLAEAEDFVSTYFKRFPGVKHYLDTVRRQAAQQGYVETLLGRRRYFPNIKISEHSGLNREEREAINAPVQGTAADIIKIAMIHLHSALQASGLSARMLLQVHDELVLECPQNELKETVNLAQSTMEKAYLLSVPLITEAHFGKNWGAMENF